MFGYNTIYFVSDVLPIFGVSLQLAVERSRCHDGIDLPLPVRNCIDYVQEHGVSVENVYKLSGIKTKVLHIRKMYNQRELVNLSEYDVPTATSVLKLFFRYDSPICMTHNHILMFNILLGNSQNRFSQNFHQDSKKQLLYRTYDREKSVC